MTSLREPSRSRSVPARSRGQATVELVMVLPVVVLLGFAVVQVAVVARHDVLVAHAAREAARAAAVATDDDAAARDARVAAERASPLEPSRMEVLVVREAELVVVTVRYRDDTDVAFVGRLVGPVTLQERVTMRREDR